MNRRNFLKLTGLSSSFLLLPKLASWIGKAMSVERVDLPNIIVLVFDAMSARNLSVYGYPRSTTPNLERFAENATVYHSHYSGGNFTTPGTSSLLTGTYPWTHRAINTRGVIKRSLVENNVFHTLGREYTRVAFPQNFWANLILTQFEDQIEHLLPTSSFSELDFLVGDYFKNDKNMAARALDDFILKMGGQQPETLVFGSIERWLYSLKRKQLSHEGYSGNIPNLIDFPVEFRLETLFDGLISVFSNLKQPFFSYLHLFPPHAPYAATNRFHNVFKDGLKFIRKPEDPHSGQLSNAEMSLSRRKYDEYIASTDHEFGRLFDFLQAAGFLENSYVFITSDHGEMFERGVVGHSTRLLYDPVVHIPLLVSSPQRSKRRDIYAPTSAVDILPTIAQLTGKQVPAETEGVPLLGMEADTDNSERSIFVVEAKQNPANRPLVDATIVLRKGQQKMIYYTGYGREDEFELYDLSEDIEEMNDLYPQRPVYATSMKEELLESFYEANKFYMSDYPRDESTMKKDAEGGIGPPDEDSEASTAM